MNIIADDLDEQIIQLYNEHLAKTTSGRVLLTQATSSSQIHSSSPLKKKRSNKKSKRSDKDGDTDMDNDQDDDDDNTNIDYISLVQNIDESKILSDFMNNRIHSGKVLFDYLRAVLNAYATIIEDEQRDNGNGGASSTYNQNEMDRTSFIINFLETIIDYSFAHDSVKDNDLKQCMDLILSDSDSFQIPALQKIIKLLAETIDKNKKIQIVLPLLPKCLSLKSILDSSNEGGKSSDSDAPMSSNKYQTNIIELILSKTWPKQSFIPITTILNDISLSKDELKMIVLKMISYFDDLRPTEYFSASSNLLAFTTQGLKGFIVKALSDYFGTKRNFNIEDNSQELHSLALVIYQINFYIKNDLDIGKDYLKLENHNLEPFTIALLLKISKISKFKLQAINLLKSLVNQMLVSNNKQDLLNDEANIRRIMSETVKQSTFWESSVDAFLNFAIVLIESNSIVITDNIRALRNIGVRLAFELFQQHSSLGQALIEEIMVRMQSMPDNLQPWFQLLSCLSNEAVSTLINYAGKLKESFEYMHYFNSKTVQQLIASLKVTIASSTPLQDSIILSLRKSMFKKELEARSSAVGGILQLLKNMTENVKDISKIQIGTVTELLSVLQRSLTQQCSIRSQLYTGLKELVKGCNEIGDIVCSLLSNHFITFLIRQPQQQLNEPHAPFSLKSVTGVASVDGGIFVSEPFDKLVDCIQFCLVHTKIPSNNSIESQSHRALESTFEKFCTFMSNCQTSSFPELHTSLKTKEDAKINGELVMGVLEAIIEYKVTKPSPVSNRDKFESILNIFKFYLSIKTLLQQLSADKPTRSGGGGGKGGDKRGKKRTNKDMDDEEEQEEDELMEDQHITKNKSSKKSNISKEQQPPQKDPLSTTCLLELFKLLNNVDSTFIKEKKDLFVQFKNFVNQSCLNYLHKLEQDSKTSINTSGVDRESRNIETFCRSIIQSIYTTLNSTEPWTRFDKEVKGGQIPNQTLMLSCFEIIIKYFDNHNYNARNYLMLFMNDTPIDERQVIEQYYKFVHSLEILCLEKAIKKEYWDDGEKLLNILSKLYPHSSKQSLKSHMEFIQRLYQIDIKIESPTLSSAIVSIYLDVHLFSLSNSKIVGQDICKYLKRKSSNKNKVEEDEDEEEEEEEEHHPNSIINDHTHELVESELLKVFSKLLDEYKSHVVHFKKNYSSRVNSLVTSGGNKEIVQENLRKEQKSLFQSLDDICSYLDILSKAPLGPSSSDKYLKVIKKLFVLLTSLMSALSTLNIHPMESLIQMVNQSSLLSSNIQNFMSRQINQSSSDNGQNSNSEDGKKVNKRLEKSRKIKESRTFPLIKFTLEKYESTVITYGKKLKVREKLGKHFQKVEDQIFDINVDVLKEKIQEAEDEEEYGGGKKKKSPSKKKTPKKPATSKVAKSKPKSSMTGKSNAKSRQQPKSNTSSKSAALKKNNSNSSRSKKSSKNKNNRRNSDDDEYNNFEDNDDEDINFEDNDSDN